MSLSTVVSSVCLWLLFYVFTFFFFNDTATTEIYTLSLHDALPISDGNLCRLRTRRPDGGDPEAPGLDRKSTRLNSSHVRISYAVFCLKKKKHHTTAHRTSTTNVITKPPHLTHSPCTHPSIARHHVR